MERLSKWYEQVLGVSRCTLLFFIVLSKQKYARSNPNHLEP